MGLETNCLQIMAMTGDLTWISANVGPSMKNAEAIGSRSDVERYNNILKVAKLIKPLAPPTKQAKSNSPKPTSTKKAGDKSKEDYMW